MRFITLALLTFLGLFLQTTIFGSFTIKGVIPDMLLILVIFYALFNGDNKGSVYGVICGLLEDLYIGRFIGINSISKGITAYIVGRLQRNVFKENILVGIISVMGGTLLNCVIIFVLSLKSIKISSLDQSILLNILYQGIYNTLIAIPMYIWYYRSSNRGLLKKTGER